MHFGPVKHILKSVALVCVCAGILAIASCNDAVVAPSISFKHPDQGQTFGLGDEVKVELDLPKSEVITSATYLLDGKLIETKTNAEPFVLQTAGLAVGYKLITAITDNGTQKDTTTINIVLNSGRKPEQLGYKVVNVFPHDTSSYTQGLEYHHGKLLESTGIVGQSTLSWVALQSGKALQKVALDKQYFGEGSTLVDDKIVMLTWKGNLGFVYNAKTLEQMGTFPYQNSREGWGICYDGTQLIKSDGTNRLYFLNKETFREESAIDVYDDKGPVDSINELEYIDGKIYANIYMKDIIVVIDPKSGIVEKSIDLAGILAKGYTRTATDTNIDVLNGIAWDKQGKRLFVTGKKWPKLFEITLVPQ
ncbi:MAG: glutaminyl-peptide cyclotransferase [Sphingobacteriales bacterium]|nr:MAG: glutaminyl-peptide cyclotransferase [Sphingobacteriales bacterium]